jgi:nitrate/nitrite-specific signal transduction histidine kinase
MKKLMTLLILVFCATLSAQTISVASAINKAGRQRMLCQRMAKDYVAIGSQVRADEAARELDESSSVFNENYNDLMQFAKNKETKDALEVVGVLWSKFRLKALGTSNPEDAATIMNDANALTTACNIVVEKILSTSGLKTAVLPNICGKERMFSQKLAVLYLANYWNVPYGNLSKELSETMANYELNLNMLINSSTNTDEINTILKLQREEWTFLKKSFDLNSENLMPASVFSSTNLMLKNFDRATTLYEKLVTN